MRALAALGLVFLFAACKPGVTPSSVEQQVVGTVAQDLRAGDTLGQVEADVAKDIGSDIANPVVAALVEDALLTLVDAGQLLPSEEAKARSLLAQVAPHGARACP